MFQGALTLALVISCVAAAPSTSLYVSSATGSDQNSGTDPSHPLQTVTRAQTLARGLNPSPVVYLNGTFFNTALSLTFPDSGKSSANPLTFTSLSASRPATLSGGVPVSSPWTQSSSFSSSSLTVYTTTLPADTTFFRQLWINGQRLVSARTDVLKYSSVSASSISIPAGQLPTTTPHNPEDIEAVVYEIWTASVHQITAINATDVTVKNPIATRWTASTTNTGSRYYLTNMLEALDSPGEFYYDSVSHELHIIPPTGVDPSTSTVIIPQQIEIVSGQGNRTANQFLENVEFRGVTLSHAMMDVSDCFSGTCDAQSADFLSSAAVHFEDSKGVVLDGVTISHTGGYGVWFNKGCSDNSLSRSHLFDLGAGGARLGPGQSGVEEDVAARNVGNSVTNSILEDGGYTYKMGCGVLAQQVVAANISHNDIHHFDYTGVSIGWTWGYDATSVSDITVSFNSISFIGQGELSDMGCVYSLGHQPGTEVHNNICHNVESFSYGGWGFYTDEGSRDLFTANNIVYSSVCAGVHQHYGLNNTFTNNVLYFQTLSRDSVIRSSRHPGTCTFPATGPMGQCSSAKFETNILVAGDNTPMFHGTIPTAFDNMTFFHNDYFADGNAVTFPHGYDLQTWQSKGYDAGSIIADPQLINATADNFGLKSTSPALPLGFVPIDTSTVGPQQSVGVAKLTVTPPVLPEPLTRYLR